jgi:hypothetical protein
MTESAVHRFRKYGRIFEENEGRPRPDSQPESPYEALRYVSPTDRGMNAVEKEQAELSGLRGEKQFHYD